MLNRFIDGLLVLAIVLAVVLVGAMVFKILVNSLNILRTQVQTTTSTFPTTIHTITRLPQQEETTIAISSTMLEDAEETSSLYRNRKTLSPPGPLILDENYAGWRGIEALEGTFTAYVSRVISVSSINITSFHIDTFWPYENVPNIFCKLLEDLHLVVIVGKVIDVKSIEITSSTHILGIVSVNYIVNVEQVVINRATDIDVNAEISKLMLKHGKSCTGVCVREVEAVRRFLEVVKLMGSSISEGTEVTVSVSAYVAVDALNKAFSGNKLSLQDIASPFPLLNPGNTYVIFLRATGNKTGAVVEDLVYGLYAFLVKDGKTYSLHYITYPVSVKLDNVKFYSESTHPYYIRWMNSKSYVKLWEEAISKLSIYDKDIIQFIDIIKGCST